MPKMMMRSAHAHLAPSISAQRLDHVARMHDTTPHRVQHQAVLLRCTAYRIHAWRYDKRPRDCPGRQYSESDIHHQHTKEPQIGIEPLTARLRIECSTTELLWRIDHPHRRPAAPAPPDGCPGADSNRDAFRHHPLKWRVYQFHHQGNVHSTCDTAVTRSLPLRSQTLTYNGSDGARTRDLSSDSRVL